MCVHSSDESLQRAERVRQSFGMPMLMWRLITRTGLRILNFHM